MIPRLALDDDGRLMGYQGSVTNAEYLASQALLMDAICMTTAAVDAADAFNGGFRYTSTGALRIYDATAGLPSPVTEHRGFSMTSDGQVCVTTGAIGADVARLNGAAVDSSGRIYVTLLNPAAWFRFGIGVTVTGQGVSTWADQSGNANDLLQATDGARPPLQSDNTILFNGTDENLACANFTLAQPETFYLLGKQVTSTTSDIIYDGSTSQSASLFQTATSPNVRIQAGLAGPANSGWALGTYAAVTVVFNGASSLSQINNGTAATGDAGATDASGFILGALAGGASNFSNIQVKEVILFAVAHDANTRLHVARYLAHNGLVF